MVLYICKRDINKLEQWRTTEHLMHEQGLWEFAEVFLLLPKWGLCRR